MTKVTRDNLIVAGSLLAIVTSAVVLVYMPQNGKLRDLRTQIAREKLRLIESANQTAAVPAMLRQVEAMKRSYSNFDRRLPKRIELGGFLCEISENLVKEKLSNQLIEPRSPTRAELYHTLPIVLRFEGSYLALAGLLERLDVMERLTQVERFSIQASDKLGSKGEENLNIELLMNIYFTES